MSAATAPERATQRATSAGGLRRPAGLRGPTPPQAERSFQPNALPGGLAVTAAQALRLQRHAGNSAVVRLVAAQRVATLPQPVQGAAPAVQRLSPAKVPGRSPGTDPKFATLRHDVVAKRKVLTAHAPPTAEAATVDQAAVAPPEDKLAQGKAAQAGQMAAAKPGEFNKAAFISAVNKAIADQAPKTLDDADKFASSGKADAVQGAVAGNVAASKEATAGPVKRATAAAPDASAATDKPVTPLAPDRPPPTPAAPDPGKAVPDRLPPSATDLSAGPAAVSGQMTEAGVSEDQLAKSNEPQFTGALDAKKAGEAHAAAATPALRAAEGATLTKAKGQAASTGAAAMTSMAGVRGTVGGQVGQAKSGAKTANETLRAGVAKDMQLTFDTTKTDTEAILKKLDTDVDEKFKTEEAAARAAFTADHKRRMAEYKDKRYSGVEGAWLWTRDLFMSLPAEANQAFEAAKAGYVKRLQEIVSGIADLIGARLAEAKARIAKGKSDLQAKVDSLPKELKAFGAEQAKSFGGKFDELTESVNAKGEELVDTLAEKYTEAVGAVDEEIETEKEKNKGLVDMAKDAIGGAIKTIMQLKDLLMGVLAKAASAVAAIISDPIKFLGNLVAAVGAGLKGFLTNIGTHVTKGLIGWLMGALASTGLELPAKWDLRGILGMLASLFGLTWAAIRAQVIAAGVPEALMGKVEGAVGVAKKLIASGISGITEELMAIMGDVRENLFTKIKEFLIPAVLTAGITWIISLLNPASAFVKAAKAIVDIVSFIMERGAQIAAFVNSVLDAVIAIANGGGGGVPELIEKALAGSIPVLIGALASLLGLGGIASSIQKFFTALQKPMRKAVSWVVKPMVKFGKKLWKKMKKAAAKLKAKAKKAWKKIKAKAKKTWGKIKKKLGFGKPGAKGKKDKKANTPKPDLQPALTAAAELLHTPNATPETVTSGLPALRKTHKLKKASLTPIGSSGTFRIHVQKVADDTAPAQLDDTKHNPRKPAPGIGSVKLWGARSGGESLRNSPYKVWHLEAEHVIPHSFANSMFVSAGLGDISDLKGQATTIMIYRGAANLKTRGFGADMSILLRFRRRARNVLNKVPTLARGAKSAIKEAAASGVALAADKVPTSPINSPEKVQRAFRLLSKGAVTRAIAAVSKEALTADPTLPGGLTNAQRRAPKGSSEAITPDVAAIQAAASAQQSEYEAMWQARQATVPVQDDGTDTG